MKKSTIPIAAIILVSAIIFSNTLKSPFMWDDKDLIVENRYVKDLRHIPLLFSPEYWNNSYPGAYRPVPAMTLAFDYFLWKENTLGYHMVNILIHTANAILIYLLLWLVAPAKGEWPLTIPFLAALFFAVHPIHTEVVAWIKNRFDLLSLFFYLLAIFFFIRSFLKSRPGRRLLFCIMSIIFFLLALVSKETTVTLPLALVLLALCLFPKEARKKALAATAPFFGITAVYLAFKTTGLAAMVSAISTPSFSMLTKVFTVVKTLGYYLKLLVMPVNLNAERLFVVPRAFSEPAVIFSLAALILLVLIAARALKRFPLSTFGLLWILITLLPASNIIFISTRPIAEQRLYIPSVGLCIILAAGFNNIAYLKFGLFSKKKMRMLSIFILIPVILFYSYTTFMRNFDWKDSITFWSKVLEGRFANSRIYNNLGTAYYDAGKYPEAIESLKKAVEINPAYATAYNNLGIAYRDMGGRAKEAIESFKKAIEARPDYAAAYNNLGGVYYRQQDDKKKAIESYRKAIKLRPDFADVYYNLGLMNELSGKTDKAIGHYKKAIALDPQLGAAPYNNLGLLYVKRGRLDEGIVLIKKALSMRPNNGAIMDSLGWCYYKKGMLKKALKLLKKANELLPDNEEIQGHLDAVQKAR